MIELPANQIIMNALLITKIDKLLKTDVEHFITQPDINQSCSNTDGLA